MTRLQQARVRRAKLRASQDRLEAALDDIVPSLEILPSDAFEAVLVYAIEGLVAQGTVRSKSQAMWYISRALCKHGMIG